MTGRGHGPLLGVLGGLTALAPLGTDMYVPGLAVMAADLDAPTWAVQLSMTAFLAGVVVGGLVLGPLSDRVGRRPVLLAGVLGFAVASGLAALAPDVVWFDLARVVQGLCGAAGLTVPRAVVTDRFDDDESAGRFATLAAITAAGPIVAPLLGGAVLSLAPWRTMFVVLGLLGLLLALGVAVWVPESRPAARGAPASALGAIPALVRRRRFAGLVLTLAFASAAVFAYIADASFVFGDGFGLSPAAVGVVFAVNAGGNLVGAVLFGRLARRVPTARLVRSALAVSTSTLAALTVLAACGAAPAPVVLALLVVSLTAFGVLNPGVTTEAQNAGRRAPGAASALLTTGQYTAGAAVSPLLGVLDPSSALVLGAAMTVCFALAVGSHLLAGR